MKIPRLDYDPASTLGFYEESLSALGALCERTWHDRLEVLAEGPAARLWNEPGTLHAQELYFTPADTTAARDAAREVFPGCPLTFRLAELLRPHPLVLEKAVLHHPARGQALDKPVLEKLWRAQFPATRHWRLAAEPKPAFHFSLVGVVRCEIQAIDQHWSLRRVAISLPGGEIDEALAGQIPLMEVDTRNDAAPDWPAADLTRWCALLRDAVELEIGPDLQAMRSRQEQYLQRELRRIDEYFAQYEKELARRAARGTVGGTVKSADRLDAAHAEHVRRRADQVARHEIRVQLHLDAVLLVAELAWEADLEVGEPREVRRFPATFVPRARRWFPGTASPS